MKLYAALFALLLLMSGCASKSYVKFVDNSIENLIKIEDVNKRVKENGLTEVQIRGTNSTDKYMLFRYRVVWEDKDGFEVPSISSNWTDFSAYKNAEFIISIIGPNKKATEYQIYIDKDIK